MLNDTIIRIRFNFFSPNASLGINFLSLIVTIFQLIQNSMQTFVLICYKTVKGAIEDSFTV